MMGKVRNSLATCALIFGVASCASTADWDYAIALDQEYGFDQQGVPLISEFSLKKRGSYRLTVWLDPVYDVSAETLFREYGENPADLGSLKAKIVVKSIETGKRLVEEVDLQPSGGMAGVGLLNMHTLKWGVGRTMVLEFTLIEANEIVQRRYKNVRIKIDRKSMFQHW